MSLPLVYRPEVRDEIDAAYAWYEDHRPGLGEQFLSALREQLEQSQGHPGLCAAVHRDVRACPLRRFPYVVYYQVRTEQILVLAVRHGRRDPQGWQSRA